MPETTIDPDWLQHKEVIFVQLKDLKVAVKETSKQVSSIEITLAIINTKLMIASVITSSIVGVVVGVAMKFVA